MSKFWKNAAILSIAEVVLKLKSFIMMPLVTKYFGTLDYGIWSQVSMLAGTVSPLVFLGTESALIRFLPGQDSLHQKRAFTAWLIFALSLCFVLCGLILIGDRFFTQVFFGADSALRTFIPLALATLILTTLYSVVRIWFRLQNQAKALVWITVLQTLVSIVVTIYILIKRDDIYQLVLWSVVSETFLLFGCLIYLFKKDILAKPDFSVLKPYLKFGIMILPAGYAIWALNFSDRLFLVHYHTLADIGVYSVAFTLGYALIQLVVNPIWNLFPTVASEHYNQKAPEKIQVLFDQSLKVIILITFPAIGGLWVVGQDFLSIFTTPSFASGALSVPFILMGYLLLMLSAYYETALCLKNKPYLTTFSILCATGVNIGLNFLLIPKYSYFGAAVATALAYGSQFTLNYYFQSKYKILHTDWRFVLKIVMISGVMTILCLNLKQNLVQAKPWIRMMSVMLFGVLVYLGALFVFKILQKSDILRFKLFYTKSRAS